jgi:hypothetical protein
MSQNYTEIILNICNIMIFIAVLLCRTLYMWADYDSATLFFMNIYSLSLNIKTEKQYKEARITTTETAWV